MMHPSAKGAAEGATAMAGTASGTPRDWGTRARYGFGVLLLLLSAGMFALVPGKIADKDAYLSAPACPAGARSADCRAAVGASVEEKVEVHDGKTPDYYLVVTSPGPGGERRLHMDGHAPVYDAVRAGDTVTLTSWHGAIRSVRSGNAVQDTRLSPVDDWQIPLGVGLAVLPLGLVMLWSAWGFRRYRARGNRSWPWLLVGAWVTATVLCPVGFFAGAAGGDVPHALLITAVGVLPAAAVGGLFVAWTRRRLRRAADVRDIVPMVPVRRKCVRASVRGDVADGMAGVAGLGYLLVGDGRPAVTPDPSGRYGLVPLAPSLVVQRVRSFRPDDPAGWSSVYKVNGIVIECRNGDERVLVATRRRDASLVLGALVAAPAPV
ncbi:hypothetical protein [Streptomyces sp. NBC_00670]|uniref:hypothetical protein n=1 Tax=Streptomyces sp. NBC_00670 TaxID=2975804 RepID=UPI002E334592|nr:hypothetical protein [Streptomyces sp. NBC_00670]